MKQNKYILVGFFTFILICFTSVLILWQTDILRKVKGYQVIGEFQHIGGLLDGAVVRYRGYPVGHVTKIVPGPKKIEVSFFVAKDIIIPVNSTVKILFDGLVGENYVGVEAAVDKGLYIKDKAILQGQIAADLATFIDLGSQNLLHSEIILTTIKNIITNPDLINSISNIILNIDKISSEILKLSSDDTIESTLVNFNQSSENLNSILANLNDPSSDNSLISIQNEIISLLKGFKEFEKSLKKVGSDENTQKIESILTNIENSSQQVSNYLGSSNEDSLFTNLGKLEIDTHTKVLFDSTNTTGYFNTDLEFKVGKYSFVSGIANTYGKIKFMNFQKGYQINKFIKTRLGIINDSEGIGLDLYPSKKLVLSAQYYNFDQTNFTLESSYQIYEALDFEIQYKNDSKLSSSGIDLGVSYQF